MAKVNKDATLTVQHLKSFISNGLVNPEMPVGVILADETLAVHGICAVELHTYPDGSKVFVIHLAKNLVSTETGNSSHELF